ncbi:MAG: hypothetical protein V4534_00195 [Myxococcota bacterium]
MIAFFMIIVLALVYQAFLNATSFLFHAKNSFFLSAPLVLAVAVFCLPIRMGLAVLMCAGILIDSLTGGIIGPNLVLLVFLGLLGYFVTSWLGKPHWPMVFSFLFGASFLYRLVLSQLSNYGSLNLILGPFADMFIGMIFFYCMPRRIIKID